MAVTEGTLRIVGGVDTHKDLHVAAVVDEQDRVMETRSFATTRQGYRQMLAWMRSFGELQRIGIEFDRQLWRRSPPFHAASRDCGSRGHDARQAGSPPAWKERRSRRPERGPCRLCRPADRDAAKPRRDDRIPAGSHGLPEDRGERQAGRPADDPQHDRLRPRRPSGSAPQPHPDATRPNVGLVAARSDRISRPGVPPIVSASSLWPAATSNCMTRSRTWTR